MKQDNATQATPTTATEAEKLLTQQPLIYNQFIEITKCPDQWHRHEHRLDEALRILVEDESFSLRHQPPPPLWTDVGEDVCKQWRSQHPEHPMVNHDRASVRRRAAQEIMTWAWCVTDAFTRERINALQFCLPDCDASVRFDLLRAVGFLGHLISSDSLREFLALECESTNCKAMAAFLLARTQN